MNKKNTICLLCMLLLSASCAPDDAGIALPLDVTAEIGTPRTRVEDAHASDYDKKNFAQGDIIKITNSKATSSVLYKRTTSGTWAPSDPAAPMTTKGSEKFTATFPSDFSAIQSDQRTYTAFWKSNQLSATATANGNRVSFSFAPAACKITVIIIYKNDNTAESATLAGKGLYSGVQSQDEEILLLKTTETMRRHTYSGIFSPKAAKTYTITVKASALGTGVYTEKDNNLTLQSGHEYQYTFTATDELILNNVKVNDFTRDPDWTSDEEDAGPAT